MKGVWVVVPAYNEERVLATTLKGVLTSAERIVVVDDGSTDGTAAVASSFPVEVLKNPANLGQGAALRKGIAHALERGATIVVTFDADGQMDPSDISRAIKILQEEKLDAVLGTRFSSIPVQEMPWIRRVLSQMAAAFFRLFYGMDVSDVNNGFRVFTREAAHKVRIHANGMAHALEIIVDMRKKGLRFRQVPVSICYTAYSLEKGQKLNNVVHVLYELLMRRMRKLFS